MTLLRKKGKPTLVRLDARLTHGVECFPYKEEAESSSLSLGTRMYIPDPIELGEMRAEDYYFDNSVGDKVRCVQCKEPKELKELTSLSADPYSPPICFECVDKFCERGHRSTGGR